VYNKEGIVEFAQSLSKLGWEIISTGGTSKVLKEAGIEILEVEDITKFPEILDGRVKTLNPYIHGGLLYRRDDENHVKTVEEMGINAIDIVVNNLYPFEETVNRQGVSQEEIIENIDIGGPSMIRAAAKNYRFVSILVDPKDYDLIIEELNKSDRVSEETNKYLAAKVFNYTAYYDALISKYFNEITNVDFPETLTLTYKKEQSLRYGENPHQNAAFYREIGDVSGSLAGGKQLHGKELSFNNINDANGALKALKEFDEPTVVAVKHSNPCGIGSGETLEEAYIKAYECDKVSIFGGIVAANRVIEKEVADMINSIFLEVVLAPGFTDEALEILTGKKNIRLIQIDNIEKEIDEMDTKKVFGGLLIQERDKILLLDDMEIVTKRGPSEKELDDLIFAWKAAKNINSNGVVLARDKATIGIGLGEVNRVWAVDEAIERGREKIEGSVMASDGFFPFKDSIELLAKNGVKAVIQPGGSIRDDEVIEEADKNGMAMIFTGIRHFKH
ncbi:MAG TPA: bifunctional phosphoribosylaminoimidazolecarboxamide formyltransferase/IMP cyclohydrolase, partial [Tissierellaceae bacterium]|nr:bifunctional phosphoribosylaminoimidazolecarboxamide formyltransferase/IMP cyclohydrolase [Tissierellaceae bacterium]